MLRGLRLALLLPVTAAAVLALHAQPAAPNSHAAVNPVARNPFFLPFISPVAGSPLTATLSVRVERPQPSGPPEILTSIAEVARDSQGRTRHDLRALVPASFTGTPPLTGIFLFDPRSHTIHALDAVYHTDAVRQVQPHSSSTYVHQEDLGTKTIDGFEVKGTRRTWLIEAELSATGRPAEGFDETWHSDDLQLEVYERRTNSFGGVDEITLSTVDRREPPPSLFKVPRGYHSPGASQVRAWERSWPIPSPDQEPNISGAW